MVTIQKTAIKVPINYYVEKIKKKAKFWKLSRKK